MRLIPYDFFEIRTGLPPEAVMQKISHVTCRDQYFQKKSGLFVFAGDVDRSTFKIAKCISYRNSFLPVLHGTVKPAGGGSIVAVKQKLHGFTRWFMTFWFGFLALFTLLLYAAEVDAADFFIPAAMMAGGYGIAYFGFWFEARNSKKLLEELLCADKISG